MRMIFSWLRRLAAFREAGTPHRTGSKPLVVPVFVQRLCRNEKMRLRQGAWTLQCWRS